MQTKQLEQRIKYNFKQAKLLQQALSHSSYCESSNNERLEFLGDAVLGTIIAENLHQTYPELTEGELTRHRASLVKGETLAEIARELGLGVHLLLGTGQQEYGRDNKSILAGSIEALIAAIYLDADFNTVKACILTWFAERLANLDINCGKDAKTSLQEYMQSKNLSLPEYKLVKATGLAHSRLFYVSCELPALKLTATATGNNKRTAEQKAAHMVLEQIND